jgi:hypothetical protein
MLNLKQFQNDFFHALHNTEHCESFLALTGLSVEEIEARFSIYRNSILGAKQNVLKTIYPVCIKLIGGECFAQLSNAYLARTNSINPDLTQLAAHFSTFIQNTALINDVPYIADIANLEWAWHSVFYGEDNEILDLQALVMAIQFYSDQLIFTLPRDAKIISSTYPIDRIWQFCQPEYSGDTEMRYEHHPVNLILWQNDKTLLMERLTTNEFILLQKLQTQLPWGEICNEFSKIDPKINLAEILPMLCQRDLVRYQTPI